MYNSNSSHEGDLNPVTQHLDRKILGGALGRGETPTVETVGDIFSIAGSATETVVEVTVVNRATVVESGGSIGGLGILLTMATSLRHKLLQTVASGGSLNAVLNHLQDLVRWARADTITGTSAIMRLHQSWVGDTAVGKSSILLKYTEQRFSHEHNVTVGVDFRSKTLKLDDKTFIKLQVWDTAGQETFGAIVRSFYRDAGAIFLVYNVKVRETFEGLTTWMEEVKANCDSDPIYILMGNQADSDEERQVTYDEGVDFMKDNDISYFFETSAFNGKNIEMAFMEATKLAYIKYTKEKMGQSKARTSINLKATTRQGTRLTQHKMVQEKKSNSSCC